MFCSHACAVSLVRHWVVFGEGWVAVDEGCSVYFDMEGVGEGGRLREDIIEYLTVAAAVVLLWSRLWSRPTQ